MVETYETIRPAYDEDGVKNKLHLEVQKENAHKLNEDAFYAFM